MLQAKCVKIKLKPESIPRVRAWAAEVNRRRDEALTTMRDEDVVVEAAFLLRSSEGDSLIYFMKGRDMKAQTNAAAALVHPIDAYHQQFKRDTWQSVEELEPLIDLDRLSE